MTGRITKKAKIEALLKAGKAPREIAKMLGVSCRYAVAVGWRMRNPEREKALKRAGRERLRADDDWFNNERERRRMRDKERRRKDRTYRRARALYQRRWRLVQKVRSAGQTESTPEGY